MVRQQDVVKAVQIECRCMQHEAARQASAMQLLESMADRRQVEERNLEHDSWESAREALGKFGLVLLLTQMLAAACSFCLGWCIHTGVHVLCSKSSAAHDLLCSHNRSSHMYLLVLVAIRPASLNVLIATHQMHSLSTLNDRTGVSNLLVLSSVHRLHCVPGRNQVCYRNLTEAGLYLTCIP